MIGLGPWNAMAQTARLRQFFRRYRVETLLFFSFWASFAYFIHLRPGWNANTRIGLTFALVDRGTITIDGYHDHPLTQTDDKAFYKGHYYCDKSPALSFLAVPFYGLAKRILAHSAIEAKVVFARQWCIVWTVGLLGALAAALFYRLMRLFGATGGEALALTFFLVYGTNLGGYTSLFFPYLPATACLLGAYVLSLSVRERAEPLGRARAAAIGFLISMAAFFEYFFGLAAAALAALVFATMRPRRRFVWLVVGALPPAAALFAFNYTVFDNLVGPYRYEARADFLQGMSAGFMGITRPNLSVLYYLTIHPYKGLFFYSPMLYGFFLGSFWTDRLGRRRADLAAAWAILVAYLLFNSSYYLWWGGWSMGSRHLIPLLPFLFMPILASLRRGPQMRSVVLLAGCVSVLLNVPPIAVDPQIPAGYSDLVLCLPGFPPANLRSPWLTMVIPSFFHGQIAVNVFSFLPHLLSLLPLAALWAATLRTAWQWTQEPLEEK